MKRKLAAILAADVVGYSKLMGDDEAGTLNALKTQRKELFDPEIQKHGGRIVKLMGDGVLVEFPSVVDAVECAIVIQQTLARNDDPIKLRIGINLGDVIIEGDDIYGDGVNLAARLEALAEPGGVCVSDIVYQSIHKKISSSFQDLGEQELKNIDGPVQVWSWLPDGIVLAANTASPQQPAQFKPAIAVLPFDNMSGDPEQEYFSDGITEDIITELSRFASLFVTARNSTFTFKGQSVNVRDVGNMLGVQYVVEGSVRKAGNRVRITVQLIETATGNHLWAERYDRELEDIFAVQDEVVGAIVAMLPVLVEGAYTEGKRQAPTDSLPAYDCILRGTRHLQNYRRHDIADARAAFTRATALDPKSARAEAGIAYTYLYDLFWNDVEARFPALEHAERAVALDRNDPDALKILGLALVKNGSADDGVRALDRAVKIVPASADMTITLGICLVHAGRHEEALDALRATSRLGKHAPDSAHEFTGNAHFFLHQYDKAIAAYELILDPPSWIHAYIAACLAMSGDLEAAAKKKLVWQQSLRHEYGEQVDAAWAMNLNVTDIKLHKRREDIDLLLDGFRKAGLLE